MEKGSTYYYTYCTLSQDIFDDLLKKMIPSTTDTGYVICSFDTATNPAPSLHKIDSVL